jgi:hypothetical protein
MMKKLLALLLVFGMASVANAGLWLSVGDSADPPPASQIVLYPSDTIEITIWSDIPFEVWMPMENQPTPYILTLGLVDDTALGNTDGGVVAPQFNSGKYTEFPELVQSFRDYLGMPTIVDVAQAEIIHTNPDDVITTTGKVVSQIIFHCDSDLGDGEVTILLVDAVSFETLSSLTIHQIPEPMTVALLGLGSLFMLRRRR